MMTVVVSSARCTHPVLTPCLVEVTERACGQIITLRRACTLHVSLTPAAGSGYLWRIAPPSPDPLTARELAPQGPDPTIPGSQRPQLFELVPRRVGSGQIVLRHERPFAPGDHPDRCALSINVVQ
jgi:hypothetical protein